MRKRIVKMKLTYDSLLKHARSSNFHKHIETWMEDGTMMRELPEFACAEWYIHNPAHHPEGSTEDFYGTVYDHVLESIRIADVVNLSPLEKLCVMFHDIGKGYCAKNYSAEHPYHNFIAHDVYGVRIMDCIGKRLNFESLDLDIIKFCIQHHMRFYIPLLKTLHKERWYVFSIAYEFMKSQPCCSMYILIFSSETFPMVEQKYPPVHICFFFQ